jgi:hypothetical protein
MTSQDAVTLTAASVGFVAAVFFCVGNFMNNSESIFKQSRPFNDISKPIAHALSAQRAQYVTGGLLLVIAFSLQVWGVLASKENAECLPQWLHSWLYLVLSAVALSAAIGFCTSRLLYASTIKGVSRLYRRQLKEDREKYGC